ncbi:FMN-dependent NADH-azoreductase [Paenibacillus hamazuiensis]|uniref:FMN-dependent NADH-azoreductase n=1 Tax=Paenibacillus hamazuiensis TaxID=2936508 RepID=UPI00200F0E41|nr:FMN-dependent NADH-azoreductase [Paenibacillus hamazuiensis]
MTTVLYITTHPLDHQVSYSLAVGKEFIEAYQKANPGDEIIHLDLYQMHLPQIDNDVMTGWGTLASGTAFDQLSPEQNAKISRLTEIVDQFVAADKYIFVSPMWNFLFPPVLKTYIDSICYKGKTFRYTANGVVGLLKNKKALHIQASGGVYSEGPAASMESGHSYLGKVLNFIGVTSFEGIFVEGMNYAPEKAQEIKEKAIEKAKEVAARF